MQVWVKSVHPRKSRLGVVVVEIRVQREKVGDYVNLVSSRIPGVAKISRASGAWRRSDGVGGCGDARNKGSRPS